MIPLSLSKIAEIVEGRLFGSDAEINSVSTDTRTIAAGDLFIALRGPNFDADKFTATAANAGAIAAIVSNRQAIELSQIVVDDTRVALGLLGAYVKDEVAPKTIAITGSNGKTTVKEMTAAIMRQKGEVLATAGNFNNEIGVPLTLLRLEPHHRYAVIELGANHEGEIAYTCSLVRPDVALINNVAPAHLEGFGDIIGVARAKGEIFSGLSVGGVAVYNRSITHASVFAERITDKQVIPFSCHEEGEYFARNVSFDGQGRGCFRLVTPLGEVDIVLAVAGQHNVCNAVAAAIVSIKAGATLADVVAGLQSMQVVPGRMNVSVLNPNLRLIDDSYNANVESTKAAIDSLVDYAGLTILVLGDMAELGQQSRQFHEEVGEYALSRGVRHLFSLGILSQSATDAFKEGAHHFSNRDSLIAELMGKISTSSEPVTILCKGSRSAKMELVVQAVKAQINGEVSSC